MLAVYIIVTVVVVLVTRLLLKYKRFKDAYEVLPGIKDFSYVHGNLHVFPGFNSNECMAYLYELSKKHRHFCRIWMGPGEPIVLVFHPELMKKICKTNYKKPWGNAFISTVIDMGKPFLGDSVLLSDGPKWHRNRKLLSPSFHFDILKAYVNVYHQCGDVLVKRLKELNKDGKSIDICRPMSLQTLDVLLKCAFSYESNCQESGSEYVEAIHELTKLWMTRVSTPSYLINFVYAMTPSRRKFHELCKFVHGVADEVIAKRQKHLETQGPNERKVRDFLDTLLLARDEEGRGLTAKEIRAEVDTFMFAGHDTTSIGLSFVFYCLAKHPEYQDKILEEVEDILGDRDSLEWQDLAKLQMTTMVIKESLRLFPPVPQVPKMNVEDVEFNGYTIPKETYILGSIFVLHKHPQFWEDPEEFKPERFHPDKARDMDPYQYMPFSGGSRNCIGQNFAMNEMRIVVPKVLKSFRLSFDESKPVVTKISITLGTANGVNLFLSPRD